MKENPAHNRQLRQVVADRLRAAILEGRLRPGEWLRQERFARELGVSQTPAREALKQLVAEGLVEHVPYRGVRVVELTRADVEDLYACRAFIESRAARYAAMEITDAEIEELQALFARMMACRFPEDLALDRELNREFHTFITRISRRSQLVRTLTQLWAAFPTMLWSNIPDVAVASVPERDEPDRREHAEIVAALVGRNPKRAERAVRHHIEAAGRTLLAAMKRRRQSGERTPPNRGDA
ncbi:MAG TPA: GntR family transcriptional regulator [Thermoanaerobaculaceae bacterium]|nr:GntR family transcriptional regulator [Thermoanaerobaculaceae bacterium]HRS16186.1 GntR family transcriptional regulator [Thermoanaerobaculaceae bacterium]